MRNLIMMTILITLTMMTITITHWLTVMRQKCCWTLPMPPLTNKQHTNTLYTVMTRMEHMQGTEPITPAMK
jgi:hypothetical protein